MEKQLDNTAYVTFTAGIDPRSVSLLVSAISQLVEKKHSHIYLAFSTLGGDIDSGIALYNFFRGLPVRQLTIHNIGTVQSIGIVIFLAAGKEHRRACKNTTFMFHGATVNHPGGASQEHAWQEFLTRCSSYNKRMRDIIVERTELPEEEVATFSRQEMLMTADGALGKKIIHDIADFQYPRDARFVSVVP